MVNLEKQPLPVQGKMKTGTQCQDFHKLFQLLWQEDSEITTRLEELRGLTMPAETHTAKPLALLPGEVFILLPFLCAYTDALYIPEQGGHAFMVV